MTGINVDALTEAVADRLTRVLADLAGEYTAGRLIWRDFMEAARPLVELVAARVEQDVRRQIDRIPVVCAECLLPLTHPQARHLSHGDEDGQLCTWPCGHRIHAPEPRCLSCEPLSDDDEKGPF